MKKCITSKYKPWRPCVRSLTLTKGLLAQSHYRFTETMKNTTRALFVKRFENHWVDDVVTTRAVLRDDFSSSFPRGQKNARTYGKYEIS